MDIFLYVLLGLAVAGAVFALARGVIGMAQGRDLSGRQSNKFMSFRVVFQLAAVAIIVLLAYLGGQFG